MSLQAHGLRPLPVNQTHVSSLHCAIPPEPQVSRLDSEITALQSLLAELSDRLTPVLRPCGPAETADSLRMAGPPPRSPLAEQVDRLAGAASMVRTMMERLEV